MAGPPLDPVAIVTGVPHPVGREIARALAGSGWAVIIVHLDHRLQVEVTLEEILAAGGAALAVRADLGDDLDVERLFRESRVLFDDVDVVVHTAFGSTDVVDRHAAHELRRGGMIIGRSEADLSPAIVDVLRARDIAAVATPTGAEHDEAAIAATIDVLERWRWGSTR